MGVVESKTRVSAWVAVDGTMNRLATRRRRHVKSARVRGNATSRSLPTVQASSPAALKFDPRFQFTVRTISTANGLPHAGKIKNHTKWQKNVSELSSYSTVTVYSNRVYSNRVKFYGYFTYSDPG